MTEPRIAPLAPEDRDPRTEELLATLRPPGGPDLNLFATLAHHPKLLKQWSRMGGTLLFGGRLTDRDREVLILRTSANCDADYEWDHHTGFATAAGLTDEEVTALADPSAAGVTEADRPLVAAADELHRDNVIGDETWAALAERLDPQQLIEVCMVVGQYHLVAYTLRSLGIQNEMTDAPGIPR